MGGACSHPRNHIAASVDAGASALPSSLHSAASEDHAIAADGARAFPEQSDVNNFHSTRRPPLPPPLTGHPPLSSLLSCGNLNVDTSFKHVWDKIEHTPTTEEERQQFLFYCPICFCHAEGGGRCSKCQHHICLDCAESIGACSARNSKQINCPHCRESIKLDLIKKTSDIIRSYVDSPRTIAQLILQQNKEVKRAKVEQFVTRSVDEALFKLSLEMKSARIIDGIIHNHMYQRSSSSTHTWHEQFATRRWKNVHKHKHFAKRGHGEVVNCTGT